MHNKTFAFSRYVWLTVGLFVILVTVFGSYAWSEKQIDRANDLRYQAYLLVDELRQSSDDLTRMARSYVVTGDPVYKANYQAILDIRDGKKPRPVGYQAVYWDLVLKGQIPDVGSGSAIPLLELMREAGFSVEEFSKLAEAKAHSDELTATEFEAMRLAETTGPQAEANRAKARLMLYGDQYHQYKAAIMQPINEFYQLMEKRTLNALQATIDQAMLLRYVFVVLGLMLMLMLWRINNSLHVILGSSLDEVYERIAQIGSGDFSSAIPVAGGMKNSVLGWLEKTRTNLNKIDDDRKRLQDEREEALDRLHKIANQVPGLVYQYQLRTDGSACFPFASAAIRDIYRITAEDVREDAAKVFALVHPDDYDAVQTTIFESARNLTPWCQEYRVKFDDGTIRWLFGDALPEREADGSTLWHGFITDITERKQAVQELRISEERLKESEAKLQLLLNSAAEAIYGIDLNGDCTFCNAACLNVLGYKHPEELLGKNMHWQIHGKYADGTFFPVEECLIFKAVNEGVRTHVDDEVLWRADGTCFPAEYWSYPQKYEGALVGAVITFFDITKRKEVEARLWVSDHALEAISQGVLISTADGCLISVNKAYSAITGYNSTEIIGHTCKFVQGPLTDPQTVAAIRLARETVTDFAGEILNYRKDGTPFWNDLTISPVCDQQGRLTHFIGITRDITMRKQVESKLIQLSERLALAVRAGGIGVWDYNIVNNVLVWDAQMFALYGINPKDFGNVYEAWQAVVYPDDKERVDTETQMAISGEKEFDTEFRVCWQDGSIHHIRALAIVQRNASGKPLRMIGTNWDITAFRQSEKALLESRDKYHAIFEGSADGIMIVDMENKMILFANSAQCQLFGYTEEQFKTMSIAEIHPEHTLHKALTEFDRHAHGDITLVENILCLKKNGEYFYADITSSFITINGRQNLAGFFRDVTERKQVEDKLRKLSIAVEQSPVTIVITDINGAIEYVNPMFTQLTGYTFAEVLGQNPRILQSGEFTPESYQKLWNTILAGEVWRGCFHNKKKSGELFWEQTSISPIKDDLGGIIGFVAVKEDITKLKQYEREIAESEQRLLDILHVSPIAVRIIVNQGSELVFYNPSYAKLFKNSQVFDFNPQGYYANAEDYQAIMAELAHGNTVLNRPIEFHNPNDGSKFWALSSYMPMQYQDKAAVLGWFYDITEAKHMELLLQEKNAELESARVVAEKANLAKSEFLASMSHELRSPLNAILGFAELMKNDFPPPSTAQKESIAQITQAGWHLLELINDILDLTKVESGQVSLSKEPVSLDEIILKCRRMIESQAQQSGIKLIFPRFVKPVFVLADPIRLKQVLLNLLSNAIKYNSKRGTVEVQCTERTPGRLRTSIRDTGAGLEQEQLAQLFQPFNRLGQECGNVEGTGIGLVVVKELVELMEGELGVDSAVGVGSVFWFELSSVAAVELALEEGDARASVEPPVPGREPVEALEQTVQEPRATQQNCLILVAEDNMSNQMLMRRQLDLLGFAAEVASDGCEAFEYWQTGAYALLFTDVNMPGMSGCELTAAIRSEEEKAGTGHTPIIALTANAMKGEDGHCKAAGMDDYLSKPALMTDLKAMLDKWLPAAPLLPVDARVLKELVGDDPAFISQFLHNFRATALKIGVEIEAAISDGRTHETGAAAHKLKSSARSVGALRLGELCEQIEQAGKTGDNVMLTALLPRFKEELAAVENHLSAWQCDLTGREEGKKVE
ncbi:MAG: PAS domain S-box protein [Methylococcaceae bacterium]